MPISRMIGTPRPSSPTSVARAPQNSTSEPALERSPSLSFSRWMRMSLRSPSGVNRGSRKQRQPARGLRQDQEGVRHRRREEPLVADDPVLAPAERLRRGGVRAQVGPALLLGHAHAQRDAALARRRDEPRVVVGREDPRQPFGRERGVARERRHDRVGHRRGTQRAVLDFGAHHEQRGALHVRARSRLGPRPGGHTVALEVAHQLVIGRVELDLVAAPAGGVEQLRGRRIAVRRRAQRDHFGGAQLGAARGEPGGRGTRALARAPPPAAGGCGRRDRSPRAAAPGSTRRGWRAAAAAGESSRRASSNAGRFRLRV